MNIKDLDDDVARRLKEQAAAAGLSVQQYLRNELILAEQLEVPLFTASDEVSSDRVQILRPW